jgi:alpha-1,3-rhamnosyltransferase
MEKARGEFVATLDADDYFLPARVSTLVKFLERDQADIVISDCYELDDNGHMTRFSEEHLRGGGHLAVEDYLRFIMPAPPMFLAKKSVLEKIDYYDEELKYLEDQDLFIRALQNGYKVSFLNEPLYVHRLRPDTLSDAKLNESLAWREAYKRHWRSRQFSSRQHRIIFAQILATTFRYYYFRYAPNLSWPKKMKILRKVF